VGLCDEGERDIRGGVLQSLQYRTGACRHVERPARDFPVHLQADHHVAAHTRQKHKSLLTQHPTLRRGRGWVPSSRALAQVDVGPRHGGRTRRASGKNLTRVCGD